MVTPKPFEGFDDPMQGLFLVNFMFLFSRWVLRTPTNCVSNGFWIKQADIEVPDHYFYFWAIQPKNNSPL